MNRTIRGYAASRVKGNTYLDSALSSCPAFAPSGLFITFADSTNVGPLGHGTDCSWEAGVGLVLWEVLQFGNLNSADQLTVIGIVGFKPANTHWLYIVADPGIAEVYWGNIGNVPPSQSGADWHNNQSLTNIVRIDYLLTFSNMSESTFVNLTENQFLNLRE